MTDQRREAIEAHQDNPFKIAQAQLREANKYLELPDGTLGTLMEPLRELLLGVLDEAAISTAQMRRALATAEGDVELAFWMYQYPEMEVE